ncbi:ATP synthase alpha/beta chain, C terminal domain, partial [Brevibacterium sp. Mu109]
LDDATKRDLARGARLMELLKQPQYSPMPFEKQTVSIFAGTNGYLDDIAVDDVLRWEAELLDTLERKTEILTVIRETKKLEVEQEQIVRQKR